MIEETVIPETEICWKHVKKCSGSIVNAATETWKTYNVSTNGNTH